MVGGSEARIQSKSILVGDIVCVGFFNSSDKTGTGCIISGIVLWHAEMQAVDNRLMGTHVATISDWKV